MNLNDYAFVETKTKASVRRLSVREDISPKNQFTVEDLRKGLEKDLEANNAMTIEKEPKTLSVKGFRLSDNFSHSILAGGLLVTLYTKWH